MDEEAWLACADPEPMLHWLGQRGSDRQLILLGCVCCRRIEDHIHDVRSRAALATMEHAADDRVTGDELSRAIAEAGAALDDLHWEAAVQRYDLVAERASAAVWTLCVVSPNASALLDVLGVIRECVTLADARDEPLTESNEREVQAALMRDVFGNPFRPVALDPDWLTSDVVALARGIYAERAFDRMPILADALQDAGCDSDDVLNHCRDAAQVHVRGCWVVDMLLNKV